MSYVDEDIAEAINTPASNPPLSEVEQHRLREKLKQELREFKKNRGEGS